MAVIGLWLLWRGDDGGTGRATHADELQAAVLKDGFALNISDGQRVIEFDRKGKQRTQHTLAHRGELRLVGTNGGAAAAWIESKKLKLVRVSTGKTMQVFGKAARMLALEGSMCGRREDPRSTRRSPRPS